MTCPATHPSESGPACPGPIVATVMDRNGVGARGCEHHAIRLMAALGHLSRCVPEPGAWPGTAIRLTLAARALEAADCPEWAEDARTAFQWAWDHRPAHTA